ncbi:hypothetical protein WUBG_07976 [Wuchereria bancrofti]|uniref:C2H2-type domain-containing protein n=1 Tax=Wuchereria bancrofti TaxID=6293 RepID=J9EVF1_WUCBA|nr:hypothetical protein WUBG_07976 [Wuchereria bancrofti]
MTGLYARWSIIESDWYPSVSLICRAERCEIRSSDDPWVVKTVRFSTIDPILLSGPAMTMEDMNACTQCGFMTNNFADFKEHIEQHENERHLTTTTNTSRQVYLLLCYFFLNKGV